MDDINIGYLGFVSVGSSSYSGGLMVCDAKGFPIEFRYSEPITPTRVQQVLYGNVLDKYIKLDVISESLIKSISSNFNIMVVQDEGILEYNFNSKFTVVRLSITKSPPLANQGQNIKIKEREYLIQALPNSNPIRVQFPSAYPIPDNNINSTLDSIITAACTMDIDEPLSRINRALELICQQTQNQTKDTTK